VNEIQKKFFKGFNSFRSHPELKSLLEELDDYMRELKAFNVNDSEVKTLKINFFKIFANFLIVLPKVLINLSFVSNSTCIFIVESCWFDHAFATWNVEQTSC
jgi:hypothetical protein